MADLLKVLVHANQVLQVRDVAPQTQGGEDAGRTDFRGRELGIVGLFVGLYAVVGGLGCFDCTFGGRIVWLYGVIVGVRGVARALVLSLLVSGIRLRELLVTGVLWVAGGALGEGAWRGIGSCWAGRRRRRLWIGILEGSW